MNSKVGFAHTHNDPAPPNVVFKIFRVEYYRFSVSNIRYDVHGVNEIHMAVFSIKLQISLLKNMFCSFHRGLSSWSIFDLVKHHIKVVLRMELSQVISEM